MDAAVDTMMADHSAKGRLQSGSTIIAALRIFEEQSRTALEQTLSEAAKVIEHRGRKWVAAMDGISEALDLQLSGTHQVLEKARRVADPKNSPSISRAVDERLAEMGVRLREHLADFREGWTAPVPKQWKDRHPFFYASALIALGTAIGRLI